MDYIVKLSNLACKTLLQTSVAKPTQQHIDNLMGMAPGWTYAHFDDAEILEFFKQNPIPGFEKIEQRFRAIRRGEHRADLFRYYYIYLYGGMFVDFDFQLLVDINDVIKDYDFIVSTIDNTDQSVLNSNRRSRAFNGYMYAKKNHPIILQALRHLYQLDLNDLGPSDGSWDDRYHIVCEHLYHLVAALPEKNNIKVYTHTDSGDGSFVLDGNRKLGQHVNSNKKDSEYIDPLTLRKYKKFNKNDYLLFKCGHTASFDKNSGIQRYVRKLSKALLEVGVKLVPVNFDHDNNSFEMLDEAKLLHLSQFDGPRLEDWDSKILNTPIDSIMKKSSHILIPELPGNLSSDILKREIDYARNNNLFVVSIFHDAVAYILKDHYSVEAQEAFLKYMNDVSASDVLVSVSKSSNDDFVSLMPNPKNRLIKAFPLLLPSDIDINLLPEKNKNNSRNISILCVSVFAKRKNHINLLSAFLNAKRVAEKLGYNLDLSLVAAYGDDDVNYMNRIRSLADMSDTKILMDISEEELIRQYKKADFTVYPSVYEGYGLPIVESLRFNRPAVFSNTSSMRELEFLGGTVTFDPYNIEDITRKILRVAIDKEYRGRLVDSIKTIKHYSWNEYANDLLMEI